MIFLQNLFRCSPQLALSVEIGVPISLCWGPANLHCLLELVIQFLSVVAPRVLKKLVTSVFSFSQ
ncbi:hypothetical protein, partial [Staphylococcus sp. EG-SA-15]|uniref:hypothetical protein n=1 Tax=Staphylococcus sp. EG-SA-15 TaxID=2767492 RepID=UPI0019810B95